MPPFHSRRVRTTRTLHVGGAVRPSERLFCLRAVAYLRVTQVGDDDTLAVLVGAAKLDTEHPSQSLADQALVAMQEPTVLQAAKNDTIYSNLRYLQRFMELTDLEVDLLAVAMANSAGRGVYAGTAFVLANSDGEAALTMLNLLAALTQADVERVQAALAMDAVLWRSGLLRSDFGDGVEGCLELLPSAESVLRRHGLSETEFLGHFLDVAPAPELEVADFEHMAGDVDRLLRLLRYGIASGVRGLNVLLHGPPGTGKTQLARLLAKELGVPLIGARSDGHDHADRQDRLRSLQLCQALLQRQSAALGLFDEIEDAFPPERMTTRSLLHGSSRKAWHHNLLESTSVPVLWIANDVDHLEPALLRRFTVIVALREPPRPARLRLLRRALGEQPVSEQWLQRAADDPGLTPADVTRAALVAKALVLPGDSAEVALEWALAGHRALRKHGERLEYRLDHRRYDLSYVNADMDLQAVVARLRARPRATMCLSGPPGSGKTAFCAHLAATLGVPLVQARASDLLDKYVGETEKRLAQLFASARDQGAVLLLDEADGLLRDRLRLLASPLSGLVPRLLAGYGPPAPNCVPLVPPDVGWRSLGRSSGRQPRLQEKLALRGRRGLFFAWPIEAGVSFCAGFAVRQRPGKLFKARSSGFRPSRCEARNGKWRHKGPRRQSKEGLHPGKQAAPDASVSYAGRRGGLGRPVGR